MTRRFRGIGLGSLCWGLILATHLAAGQVDQNDITVVAKDERHVHLSVASDDRSYPGSYKVDVYLPPDYSTQTQADRVLYVFDGADLSREHDALLQEGLIQPALFVSIQNKSSQSRFYDLTPSPATSFGQSSGGLEAFGNLIAGRIKPYIDAHFRTLPGPEYTGVVGSSLGGLAACWLGYFHPDTFGLAACLEPSLWWNDRQLLKRLQQDSSPKTRTRFWIMAAEQEYPGMWRDSKRAAFALLHRGWREGEDLAFLQVHNGSHGWDSCKTQLRDMLHFLLRKSPPGLIDVELTNCQGPQHEAIRLRDAGEFANAYVDLHYTHGLHATAIAPSLRVADTKIVVVGDPVLGQLWPVGPGWTTVSTTYHGFKARLAVQGFRLDGYPRIEMQPASGPIVVDGNLSDWSRLPFEKTDGDGHSAGFRFGITYDANSVYIGVCLKDEAWIAKPTLGEPLNQDGLEVLVDARPDPWRSLGRGKERYFDFVTVQMAPGESLESMKLRRTKDGESAIPNGLRAACVRAADGYAAEIAIPAAALDKAQGGSWKELRVNVCQFDLDDPNGPVRRIT
jgi:predicted alpha/beta superfamily hydrolase